MTVARILQANEALGTVRVCAEQADPNDYARRLRQSSVLDATRSFVAWYAETPKPARDEYGRPQSGTVRVEIARGLAL